MKPVSPDLPMLCHSRSASARNCTWKRMNICSSRIPLPGIDARIPIRSGLAAVSQTLTVAQSSFELRDRAHLLAVPMRGARGAASEQQPRRSPPGSARADQTTMTRDGSQAARSAGMSDTVDHGLPPRTRHTVAFDALYRKPPTKSLPTWSRWSATAARPRMSRRAAFERAYRKRDATTPARAAERAWLFGIARNAALDELRRRQSHRRAGGRSEDPAAPTASRGRRRRRLPTGAPPSAGLASARPGERELIALKFHAGLTNAEIARVLGISESNAGTRSTAPSPSSGRPAHDPSQPTADTMLDPAVAAELEELERALAGAPNADPVLSALVRDVRDDAPDFDGPARTALDAKVADGFGRHTGRTGGRGSCRRDRPCGLRSGSQRPSRSGWSSRPPR